MLSKKIIKVFQFINLKTRGLISRVKHLSLKWSGNPRPSSYPIVTGDSFRALAQHIYDETGDFIPGAVSMGDIIFVCQGKALSYLKEVHPEIIVPYILIVHNGDQTFDQRHIDLFDENIIHCFAQNTAVKHDKVTPIPIGLANYYHFYHTNKVYKVTPKKIYKNEYSKRKNRFFYRFFNGTCMAVRPYLNEFCIKHPLMDTVVNRVSQDKFIDLLSSYKFLVAPRGNAIDTHRPYESFHLGIIPVVQDSVAMRELQKNGLPLWIVRDWVELNNLTESDLAKKYETLMESANFDSMHMDFWINMIKKFQYDARAF